MRIGIGIGLTTRAPSRAAGGPPPEVAPNISAAPVMAVLAAGDTLSHTPGSYGGFPAPSVSVLYRVDGVEQPASYAVTAGQTVLVEETASNSAGSITATSAPISVAAEQPGAITDLSALPGDGQVVLSWSAPASNGAAITDYRIEVDAGSGFTLLADGASSSTGYTHTGLTNETAYTYRVAATNSAGTGPVSNTASATPSAPAAQAPILPGLLANDVANLTDTTNITTTGDVTLSDGEAIFGGTATSRVTITGQDFGTGTQWVHTVVTELETAPHRARGLSSTANAVPADQRNRGLHGVYKVDLDNSTSVDFVASSSFDSTLRSLQVVDMTAPLANPWDIWILAGQSNMAATTKSLGLDPDLDGWTDPRLLYIPGATMSANGSIQDVVDASRGPLVMNAIMGGAYAAEPANNGVSPGIRFGQDLVGDIPSDRSLCLVAAAISGTALQGPEAAWNPDGSTGDGALAYNNARDRGLAALAQAPAGSRIAGVIWAHGEADYAPDMGPSGSDYPAAFAAMRSQLETDWGVGQVPWILLTAPPGGIATYQSELIRVQTAMDQDSGAPEAQPLCYAVARPGGPTEDGTHATAAQQRIAGALAAAKVVDLGLHLPPALTAAPTVTTPPVMAALTAGDTLSHTPGTYAGTPAPSVAVTYRVDGAVQPASFVVSAGESVTVEEVASNSEGSVQATSAAVTVATQEVAPFIITPPVIAALTEGDTIISGFTTGSYGGTPAPTLTANRYMRNGTPVSAATVVSAGDEIYLEQDVQNTAGSLTAVSNTVTVSASAPSYSYASAIAVGDSITIGGAGGVAPFMDQVATTWGASLDNNGIAGTILQNGADASGSARTNNLMDTFAARTITPAGEAIVCAYGFNDARYVGTDGAGNGYPDTLSPALYKADLQSCCRRWLQRFGRDNIWLVTPHYITDSGLTQGTTGFTGQTRAGFEEYVTACREVAEEFGVKLVDTYAAGEPATRVDHVHPDAAAVTRMAALFDTPLTSSLPGGSTAPAATPLTVTVPAGTEAYLITPDGATETQLTTGANSVAAGPHVLVYRSSATQRWEIDAAFVVPADLPDAIADLAAVPGDGQVVLSWTPPAENGAAITDYLIELSENGGASWAPFSDSVSADTSAIVTGLSNGTAYSFRVSAVNAVGTGAVSNTPAATPSGGASIASIVGAAAGDAVYAPTGAGATMWQDTGGTQTAADGDPVARVDAAAGTVALVQASAGARPLRDAASGLLIFDEANERHIQLSLPSRTADMYLAFVVNLDPGNVRSMLVGTVPTGRFLYPVQSDSGSSTITSGAGSPQLIIDGQPFGGTTRLNLYDALADGVDHLVEIVGADLSDSDWANLAFGHYSATFAFNGLVGDVVVLPTPSGADQAVIRTELAARHGISL